MRGGREVRGDDVGDVGVVARLAAVAVDGRLLAGDELAAEDRDDPGLAEGVLTRAVDVAVAQRHRRQAVEPLVPPAVRLGAELARPVRGHRARGDGLGRRDRLDVAVDRAARRGVHDPRDARPARRLEHVDRPADVDPGIPRRILDRLAHVDLRREVEDDVGPRADEHLGHALGVGDVDLVEGDPAAAGAVEVADPARREVVDDGHLVAAVEQGVDEVRSDEAGSAGHEGAHGGRL